MPQDKTRFSPNFWWHKVVGTKSSMFPCTVNDVSALYSSLYSLSLCPSPLRPSSLQIFWENSWGPDEGFGCLFALPVKTNISQDESHCPQDVYTQLPFPPLAWLCLFHPLPLLQPPRHTQTNTNSEYQQITFTRFWFNCLWPPCLAPDLCDLTL